MTDKKVKIILHGYLKKLYEGVIELSGKNAAELINGMCKYTGAFNVKPNQQRHLLSLKGFKTNKSLYEPLEEDLEELHVYPAMVGGKSGGGGSTIQIIIGVVLIVVGIALLIYTWGTSGWMTTLGISLLTSGAMMTLGGIISMMQKQPKVDQGGLTSDEASKYLGASQNTTKIGTRIPIGYGRMKCYGHYLSFDVDAKDIVVT